MKLEDLLVRHNKTDLFQKRANFQLEDFRYDQIARAALDKAIEQVSVEGYLPYVGYDYVDFISADDMRRFLNNMDMTIEEVKGFMSKYGLDRVSSEGIDVVVNHLAGLLVKSMMDEEGIEDSAPEKAVVDLTLAAGSDRALEAFIQEGLDWSVGCLWDRFFEISGGYPSKSSAAFEEWMHEKAYETTPSDTRIKHLHWSDDELRHWDAQRKLESSIRFQIVDAARKAFAGKKPTRVDVWGFMDNYARNVLAPSIYSTYRSQWQQ